MNEEKFNFKNNITLFYCHFCDGLCILFGKIIQVPGKFLPVTQKKKQETRRFETKVLIKNNISEKQMIKKKFTYNRH